MLNNWNKQALAPQLLSIPFWNYEALMTLVLVHYVIFDYLIETVSLFSFKLFFSSIYYNPQALHNKSSSIDRLQRGVFVAPQFVHTGLFSAWLLAGLLLSLSCGELGALIE